MNYSNNQDRNDYDVGASQTAQENFNTVAQHLEAVLNRRETDVRNAMAAYQADGVSDQYAAVEAQWNAAGIEIRGIISSLKSSLEQNDEIAIGALNRAASYIPG